ncbi:MAG: acyl-CoA dehydrogenase family protein [Pseudomonadota bacterium]
MDFGFSQEQQQIKDLAHKVLSEQVSAQSLSVYDEYAQPRIDFGLWKQLCETGLVGMGVEPRFGGMGYGMMELALFVEEVGRSIAPVPVIAHCVSAMLPIQRFASIQLKESILPAAVKGDCLLSAALSEPLNEDPTQPSAVSARADGDVLILSGVKSAVPYGMQAQRILLAARSADGIAVVLLDTEALGVERNEQYATQFEPQCELLLNEVRVPPEDIITLSDGEVVMRWVAQHTVAAICAHQLGACDQAVKMAASYTSERKQFDVPVATFQAVGHRLADCYMDVECLRLCTQQAASLLTNEADADVELHIAKIWAGDVGHRASYACQHVHGGTGIDRDYPLWRYCLWLRHNEMTLGSSAVHLSALGKSLACGAGLFS